MFSIVLNTIGFVLSVFLGSLFLITNKWNKSIHLLNGLLLLTFAILILNSLRILIFGPDYFRPFEMASNLQLLTIGPILYLIAKYEVAPSTNVKKDLVHFLPFLIFFSSSLLLKLLTTEKLFSILELITGLFLIVSLSIYLFFSLKISLQNKTKIGKPTLYALIGFALVWHINLVIQFLEFFTDHINEEAQIWATLLLSFLVIILSYAHWIKILKEINPIKSKLELNAATYQKILQKTKFELTSNKPYLDPNFTLQKLSHSIKEPSSYVSKVINKEMGVSFPIYIAKLRVDEFTRIAKLPENQNLTIKSISEKVGFKSSSTFNKAFKKHMGMLPSAYLKSITNP